MERATIVLVRRALGWVKLVLGETRQLSAIARGNPDLAVAIRGLDGSCGRGLTFDVDSENTH